MKHLRGMGKFVKCAEYETHFPNFLQVPEFLIVFESKM